MNHLDETRSRHRWSPPAAVRALALDRDRMDTFKRACVEKLLALGAVNVLEAGPLASRHIDDLLDRIFQHCGYMRARTTGTDYIMIQPGGVTLH